MRENRFFVGAFLTMLMAWPMLAGAGPIRIATGPDSSADGYLDIAPDEYGSWAEPFVPAEGPNDDHFNPLGDDSLLQVAFTSGFFMFVPSGSRRELLSDNADWQAVFPADTSLSREILAGNAAADTDGDGVSDTLTSSFRVFRVAIVSVQFDVTQHVSAAGEGVAVMQQDYTLTNLMGSPITLKLARAFDGDLLWDADFGSDEVGTTMHSADLGPFVFEQDPDAAATAITLSSTVASSYFGGKHGVEPEGGLPAYGFGTDVQIWDNFGIPTSWLNHIAGVGYDTDGISGAQPEGSTDPFDGFMGMGFEITLGASESTTLTVFHTYGQNAPVSEEPPVECAGDANGDGVVDPLDSGFVLSRFGCLVGTGDPTCDAADQNGDGTVDPLDSGFVLARFGTCSTVDVTLVEFSVTPEPTSAPAGTITFHVANAGSEVHEFLVIKTDLPPDGLPTNPDGTYEENGPGTELIDEIEGIAPGTSADLTLNLDVGNYVLICNLFEAEEAEAHYQLGMYAAFTVE